MARENGLVLVGEAGNTTSDSSMELSKQSKKSLSHGRRAPEACSIDPSDNSDSPSFKFLVENKKYPEREGPSSRNFVSRTERTVAVKRCNSSPYCAYKETSLQRDDTTNCKELAVGETPTTTKRVELLSVFSPSPTATPRSVPVRRRTWEKEIDKITIYADLSDNKSSDDEQSSPRLKVPVREILQESPCPAAPEDSFLYLLRKATKFGSFRPRLCRGVDVVDSTRTKTSKIHFRSKAKEEVNKLLFKSHLKNARSRLFDEPARKSASSFAELVRKNQIRLPEKAILPSAALEKKCITFADTPVKEFKTLAEFFESKERNSPILKLMNEPHTGAGTPMHHLRIAQPESRPPGPAALATDPQEVDPPQPEPRPFGNYALDATDQKTMEVLEQVSTSGRVGKSGAIRRLSLEISEAEVSPVSQGEAKKIRSELKGNKQDVKVDCRHSPHSGRAAKIPEDSSKNTSSKQRRCKIKELSGVAIASSETSPARCG